MTMLPPAGTGNEPGANPYAAPVVDWSDGQPEPSAELADADRGARLVAALVDRFLLLAATIPGWAMLFAGGALADEAGDFLDLGILLAIGVMCLGAFVLQTWQWFLVATTGQSLGKKLRGIRIVRMDGSPVDLVSGVVLRSWVNAMLYLVPMYSYVDVLAIFGSSRRCIHDHLAGTRVVWA